MPKNFHTKWKQHPNFKSLKRDVPKLKKLDKKIVSSLFSSDGKKSMQTLKELFKSYLKGKPGLKIQEGHKVVPFLTLLAIEINNKIDKMQKEDFQLEEITKQYKELKRSGDKETLASIPPKEKKEIERYNKRLKGKQIVRDIFAIITILEAQNRAKYIDLKG